MSQEFDPKKYFRMIEQAEYGSIGAIFASNAIMNFGAITLSGRDDIVAGYRDFLGSMDSYHVDILHIWRSGPNGVIVESVARGISRVDQSAFRVPMVSIFEIEGDQIKAQRDYFDPGPMMPNAQKG